jgi:hypothetical protein
VQFITQLIKMDSNFTENNLDQSNFGPPGTSSSILPVEVYQNIFQIYIFLIGITALIFSLSSYLTSQLKALRDTEDFVKVELTKMKNKREYLSSKLKENPKGQVKKDLEREMEENGKHLEDIKIVGNHYIAKCRDLKRGVHGNFETLINSYNSLIYSKSNRIIFLLVVLSPIYTYIISFIPRPYDILLWFVPIILIAFLILGKVKQINDVIHCTIRLLKSWNDSILIRDECEAYFENIYDGRADKIGQLR